MTELLQAGLVDRLVGVIDLLDASAVHAVAGQRHNYLPIDWCDGDPLKLAQHYRGLGVNQIYVADLNALTGGQVQFDALNELCKWIGTAPVLLDIGWTGHQTIKTRDAISDLATDHPSIQWIAATESCQSISALSSLAEIVSAERMLVGLDYRSGSFVSHAGDEADWVDVSLSLGVVGFVILDVHGVGTGRGPVTESICRRVKSRAAKQTIYSGGGIRDAGDVRDLLKSGCSGVLVATALYP